MMEEEFDEDYRGYEAYKDVDETPQEIPEQQPELFNSSPEELEAEQEEQPYLDSFLPTYQDEEEEDDDDLDFDIDPQDEQDLFDYFEDDHAYMTAKLINARIKKGASVEGLQPQAIALHNQLASDFPGIVLTSGTDGTHQPGQYSHANGYKFDIGANSSDPKAYAQLKARLKDANYRAALEERYNMRFIDEGDHLDFQARQTGGYTKPGIGHFNNDFNNPFVNSGPGVGNPSLYGNNFNTPDNGLKLPDNYSPLFNPIGINRDSHGKVMQDPINFNVDINKDGKEEEQKKERWDNPEGGVEFGTKAFKTFGQIKSGLAKITDSAITGVSSLLEERNNRLRFNNYLKDLYADSEKDYYK